MATVDILNPAIYDDTPNLPLAPQLKALRDARIAFVDNSKVNADLFLSRVRAVLGERYGINAGNVVRKLAPKDDLSPTELDMLAASDAVIQGFGD
jgi:hypothetical protein